MRNAIIAGLLALAVVPACKSKGEPPAADNTARNDRDRAATPTADQSGNARSDIDLTQAIRKSVMADSSLSTNAHNCKIVVKDGAVTLVGPVASADEKAKIEQLATAVVGAGKVTNQLEVSN